MLPDRTVITCVNVDLYVLWHSPESSFTRSVHELNPYHVFGNYTFKFTTSPRDQWVNLILCVFVQVRCRRRRQACSLSSPQRPPSMCPPQTRCTQGIKCIMQPYHPKVSDVQTVVFWALLQRMAWCWIGNKPLLEPVLTNSGASNIETQPYHTKVSDQRAVGFWASLQVMAWRLI